MATENNTIDEDYPKTLPEFEERFFSEAACWQYLEELRWPDGFVCPACGSRRAWKIERGDLKFCRDCHRQTSATAGTIFHRTRKPLRLWFRVMWLITCRKSGASALDLQRQLGFTRYETVWVWLHKLRRAMVRPGRDRLTGEVEVDETYLGGHETGVRGRETDSKSIVVVAAEKNGPGIGRIRLGIVKDVTGKSLIGFAEDSISPGSTIFTDGWRGYNGLGEKKYVHNATNIQTSGKLAHELLPCVHRVASLLKRWWLGILQGGTQEKHLQYYLDEFTFRFNRRKSSQRGKLFFRLVQQSLEIDPINWEQVCRPRKRRPKRVQKNMS